MPLLNGPFDSIKDIVHDRREALRLKVRVVRVWEICQKKNPANVFSVEMVLVDSEGGRIQASIRKTMIRKFRSSIVEGGVYKMIYFRLVENGSEYRACSHEFKLLFQPRTRIFPTESEVIPRFGIQAKNSEDLQETNDVSQYMFDFIGLLTAVGEEKEFIKFGRPIRVLEIKLTDDKGVMKCSLFGHFIEMMKNFLANGVDDLGILVIQFAKVKEYLGKVSLHTVSNSTRLLWNPQIPEVISFKDSIMQSGVDMHGPLKMIGHNYYSPTEEFLIHFPRKSIEDLHITEEEGHFICLGTVEGIVKDDHWWYMACKCHKSVNLNDSGTYYCSGCVAFVSDVTPRYKLKLEVRDHSETAHFMLFDFDAASLLSMSCASIVGDAKVPTLEYPPKLDIVIGKELLFKVEVKAERAFKFDDSFKVKRTYDDDDIIQEFKSDGSIRTPKKMKLKGSVNEVLDVEDELPGDQAIAPEIVPVIELYNESEMSPLSLEESSSAAACLAPQKRKPGPRAGRGGLAKKSLHPNVLKVEKD
ncbi:hypothetical protein SESBI_43231 [Sesbania bispinosa]|nr:hypothetical protein SESBI_43231 [Sesbania bispinosa]